MLTPRERALYMVQKEIVDLDEKELNKLLKEIDLFRKSRIAKSKAEAYMGRDISLTVMENGKVTKKLFVRKRISSDKKVIITDPFMQELIKRASDH